MLFNGDSLKIPACSAVGNHMPGMPDMCTFDAFMARVEEMSIKDFDQQCKTDQVVTIDWD
jgi:acid phosphatase